MLLLGCPGPGSESAPVTPEPTADTTSCGLGARFESYDWIPADARLATVIERDDPGLDSALKVLVSLADSGSQPEPDGEAQPLPVFAALDYRNLPLQLSTLDNLLDQLALAPAELVELQGPSGDFVWLWPSDCPRETIAARVLDRFGLMMRVDLDHPGQRRALGSTETLPFDLLAIGERRIALTLAGRGAAVGSWLDSTSSSADDAPGPLLATIPAAPIRSILRGESLLSAPAQPEDPHTTPASPRLRRLRVLPDGWEDVGDPSPAPKDPI